MSEALRVCDLVKRYGAVQAVAGVSFTVERGEIFGLLGTNGAGKTTTLECLIGLREPDGGTIEVCGLDRASGAEEVKQRIGVALQATALQDRITPREALKLIGTFYPRRMEAQGLLERFALLEKADAPFETLSAGQQQRLALALAFVNQPEILFLDEPTAGLDAQSRRDLHAAIRRLREEGRTVLLTTHYIEEAQALCDRVAVIDAGRIVALGKPGELIGRVRASAWVVVSTARELEAPAVHALAGVEETEIRGGETKVKTGHVGATVIALVHLLEAQGNDLLDLRVEKPSLEDIFLEVTRRSVTG